MDDFLFTKNDKEKKSDSNELLLDLIMEEQKKREQKHNITKGYMLKKVDSKTGVSVFHKSETNGNTEIEKNHQNQNFETNRGEPMFVVGNNSGKTFYSNKPNKKHTKRKNLMTILICSFILLAITFGAIFLVILNTKTTAKITCGNFNGIEIVDVNNKPIKTFALKANEKYKFKINLQEGYLNSVITVTFNNVELKPNAKGFYEVKNTNKKLEIHISGVRLDTYENSINIASGSDLRFIKDEKVYSTLKESFLYGTFLEFTIKYSNSADLLKNSYSVYYGNEFIEPTEANISNAVYKLKITRKDDIKICNFSPYKFFEFSENKNDKGEIVSYKINDLTTQGKLSETISFPEVYNEIKTELNFSRNVIFENAKKIMLSKNSANFNFDYFDQFNNLENIEVYNATTTGNMSLYSTAGVLYQRAVASPYTTTCLKVPKNILKNSTNKTLYISGDILATGACNGLSHIKKLQINFTDIKQMAFNKSRNYNEYEVESLNPNFTVENNFIYKGITGNTKANLICVLYGGETEYSVPNYVKNVGSNAFANSGFTKITVSTIQTVLQEFAFAGMPNLAEFSIQADNVIINDNMFFGDSNLKILDLTKVTNAFKFSASPFGLVDMNALKIITSDKTLNKFKELNPTFITNFIAEDNNN